MSTQRAHLLKALQDLDEPVTAAQLANQFKLHVNTVREHLDALVDRDLAVRGRAAASGRGRPAHTYLATRKTEHDSRVRDYAGSATALAGHIAPHQFQPRPRLGFAPDTDTICGVHLGIVQGALHLFGADPWQGWSHSQNRALTD